MTSFFLVLKFFSGSKDTVSQKATSSVSSISSNKFTAVIKQIDKRTMKIFNINIDSSSEITIDDGTKLLDKNDCEIDISRLKPGNIIDISCENGKTKSINIAKDSWAIKHVNNFDINQETKKISFENKSYKYSDETIIRYKDQDYDFQKINPLCVINISGLDKDIWFIDIFKSYGVLNLTGLDKITNGKIRFDDEQPVSLKNLKSKNLSEGSHVISVNGDNIETYSKDIFINGDETLDLNLSEVQFKCGILKIDIGESNCDVYIDNKKISITEPIVLNYGEYKLKIKKDGFKDYSEDIIIDSANKYINISLEKKINLGKIRVTTNPDNAQIYIDDAFVGKSPTETSIEYGNHNIIVLADGYLEAILPVEVNSPESNYEISLEENSLDDHWLFMLVNIFFVVSQKINT